MQTTLVPIALSACLAGATPVSRATPVGSGAPAIAQPCSQACLADVMAALFKSESSVAMRLSLASLSQSASARYALP